MQLLLPRFICLRVRDGLNDDLRDGIEHLVLLHETSAAGQMGFPACLMIAVGARIQCAARHFAGDAVDCDGSVFVVGLVVTATHSTVRAASCIFLRDSLIAVRIRACVGCKKVLGMPVPRNQRRSRVLPIPSDFSGEDGARHDVALLQSTGGV